MRYYLRIIYSLPSRSRFIGPWEQLKARTLDSALREGYAIGKAKAKPFDRLLVGVRCSQTELVGAVARRLNSSKSKWELK